MVELISLVNSVITVNSVILNDLTQMVNFPTRILDCDSYSSTLLDFFLSSHTSICSTNSTILLFLSPCFFHWANNVQVKAHVQLKLNHGIRSLSKLRHNTNLRTLKIVYHSLSASHLQYGAQLWGLANKESQNKIQVIQNQALRKINFKKLHDPTAQLYKDFKLLKFCDYVHLWNCFFRNQTEQNEKLAKSFFGITIMRL